MPWGGGAFNRFYGATGWTDDKLASTFIVSSRHDTHDQDLADGINACITRDNQAKPTADFAANATNSFNLGTSSVSWKQLFLGTIKAAVWDDTNSILGYFGRTTAEAAASITPLNLFSITRPEIAPKRFGAAGDGTTDDTAALQNWLTVVGRAEQTAWGVLEGGIYKYTATLNIPINTSIIGAGGPYSILKPTAAVTTSAVITTASTLLRSFAIDGANTTNAIGLSVAPSLADYLRVELCSIQGFAGATGIGVKPAVSVNTIFKDCLFTANGTNVRVKGTTNAAPTTLSFEGCRNASSTVGPGYYFETGNLTRIIGGVAESNKQEGVLILPATNGSVNDFEIQGLWLEANYANNIAKYHVRIGDGTAIGTAIITGVLRDVFFNVTAGVSCKSLQIDGSAIQDVLVDNPRFPTGTGAGEISISNAATVRIANFPYNKTYATLVTDTTKTTIAPDGINTGTTTRTSYTEVVGGGSITSTYRCTLRGRRCQFTASIVCAGGATIASVANTSFLTLTGAPVVTQNNVCNTLRMDNVSSLGQGQILLNAGATAILTPPWGAVANATYMIQGEYEF